ncbi:MAG: hypothetical protein ABIQ73_12440 [Acidimicrobiales bacterium]
MKKKIGVLAAAAAATAAFVLPATASAAPSNPSVSIVVDCPLTANDGPVTANPGNGQWTPVFRDHTVFIPVAFGAFTGTFTTSGNPPIVFPISDPPVAQNASKGGSNPRLSCSFTIVGTDQGGTFQGTGTVTVAVVGKP